MKKFQKLLKLDNFTIKYMSKAIRTKDYKTKVIGLLQVLQSYFGSLQIKPGIFVLLRYIQLDSGKSSSDPAVRDQLQHFQ